MFTEANESFQGLSPLAASSPDTLPPSPTPTSAKPKKKRKATYILRKEEQSTLQQEIERLESQVAVLKTRNLPPEEAAKADPVLQRREAENAALTSVLRHQQLHVANAQSLLSRCLGDQYTHPLYTSIRLTKDWPDRRATLRAFVKLHKPQFPVSPFALQELHEGIARWGDVMLKTVRSVVYTTA
ncbi:hypothetical protein KRP22_007290 [Phytophthora ramorum]|nr:hypothetical protein KRP22_4699 [Phytophthora ramorum]